ncbi:MAG: UDP-N-acetylmuramate dehydrogenase [Pseudomonadales bacterium]|jgi:UDP-N-acetylmuramate dehydrogenase|nr:UDP-N-acetylmuramate dehydrogenase [Pseudomonadales bacterium]
MTAPFDLSQLQLRDTTIVENFPLSAVSYFKIGGKARYFLQVKYQGDLPVILNYLLDHKIPYHLFGSMSNVLFADEDFSGVMIQYLANDFLVGDQKLRVSAGAKMSAVAKVAIESGLAGLAEFESLPGTIGGAIYNNSHYGDKFITDHLVDVEVFDPETRGIINLKKEDLELDYDQSIFHRKNYVIIDAVFRFPRSDSQVEEELAKLAREKREASQPLSDASAGCFFQNPLMTDELKEKFPEFKDKERISAGFLIDQCGLKGKKSGGAQISTKHAAFIINAGGATAKDVLTLAQEVMDAVEEKFGVKLEKEVIVITENGK